MVDELNVPPPARPPLGPGDDDPLSPPVAVVPELITGPLLPGDDDPASPPKLTVAPPASTTVNPDDDFDFLAPAPPGPGDPQTGPRHVVRIPKVPPTSAVAVNEQE
jgi:hypothetical protein